MKCETKVRRVDMTMGGVKGVKWCAIGAIWGTRGSTGAGTGTTIRATVESESSWGEANKTVLEASETDDGDWISATGGETGGGIGAIGREMDASGGETGATGEGGTSSGAATMVGDEETEKVKVNDDDDRALDGLGWKWARS
jgi:hypothetical protein